MKANAKTRRTACWLTGTTLVVAAFTATASPESATASDLAALGSHDQAGQATSCQVGPMGPEVVIIRQPANRTVQASQTVTFSVLAAGISPDSGGEVFYHWHKDGVPLEPAEDFNPFGRQLVIPFPTEADAGNYQVLVSVVGKAVLSDAATLTVTPDITPPTIVGLNGSDSFNTALITWSEPVTEASAETVGNYSFTGGLTVTGAELINSTQVRLTTSTQAEGASYTLTANGVRDTANNASAASAELKSFVFQTGSVNFGTWQNQTGGFNTWVDNGVQNLPPTTQFVRTSYNSSLPSAALKNYFGQLKGFFIPPQTGNYVFYLASAGHGELYLSPDLNPANAVKIAEEPAGSAAMKWDTDGTDNSGTRGEAGTLANRSDQYPGTRWPGGHTISLTAGTRYYLEMLYHTGEAGGQGAATFTFAGDPAPANGSTALTGNVVGTYAEPGFAVFPIDFPRIVSAPTHQFVAAGEFAAFAVEVESGQPLSYQWYRNNKLIPGADQATLIIPCVGVQNVGDYLVQVSNFDGSFTSDDNNSRIYLKNAFVIETEDYNHSGGQTVAAASIMPLAANLYQGLDGHPDIDFHINGNSTGDPLANGNAYRNGWNNGGTAMEWPGFPDSPGNVDIIADSGQGQRPDYYFNFNYRTGWGDQGDWYQFTRDFPPGKYAAVFYGGRDGRAVDAMTKVLSIVTGDITQPDAAVTNVGWAVHDQTGGWGSNDQIPFLKQGAPSGSTNPADLATFALDANTTVRLTLAVGDGDLDALFFYKVDGGGETPSVSAVRNANGSITVTFTGTLEVAEKPEGPYVAQPAITSPYTFTPGAGAGAQFARSRN